MRDANHLPDLLNDVFDLPLDWEFSSQDREISLDVLQEFSRLAHEIAVHTADSRYHSAISFIWSVRKYVGVTRYKSDDFVGTAISSEASTQIAEYLKHSKGEARNKFAPSATSGPTLSALILHPDRDLIFEIFLEKERLVLRNWGLNQQSVEIVIERLRAYRFKTFLNLEHGGSINSDTIGKCCLALQTVAKLPVAVYSDRADGVRARSSTRSGLVKSKDKIVGIATLFGDASPLVFGQGLDVASWISTSAGATVMALLPRGKPRP